MVDSKGMTDLEKENEKNEFESRYRENLKKIELLKQGSRFVSKATLNENNQEVEKPVEPIKEIKESKLGPDFSNFYDKEEQTDMHKEAVQKKYGKLTRTEHEWRPNPILCKRFNIPNPYKDTKEYGTVKDESEKKKSMKFSLFNIMTAESRFDKEKSKSLFDEINAETQLKESTANVKTITLLNDDQVNAPDEHKIEFESKTKEVSEKSSDFFEKIQDMPETKTEKTISNENVYLQERPDFDMFKAIFENEEDNEEIEETMELEESEKDKIVQCEVIEELPKEKITVPSSVSNIDVEKINRYLNDDTDIIEIKDVKPIPEAIKFTKL
ncbi:G patch domain-containing 1-like, partial [Brachionus plicatilis]